MTSSEERFEQIEQDIEILKGRLLSLQLAFLGTSSIAITVNAAQGIKTRELILDLVKAISKVAEEENADLSDPFAEGFRKGTEKILLVIEELGNVEERVIASLSRNQNKD